MTSENKELVLSTIKQNKLPTVKEMSEDNAFWEECNGGVKLLYHSRDLAYESDSLTEWFINHSTADDVPDTIVYFKHPSGARAAMVVKSNIANKRTKIAAAEITDPVCAKADCRGGGNCLARRLREGSKDK